MDKVKYAIEIVDKWGKPLNKFERDVDRVGKKRIRTFDSVPGKAGKATAGVGQFSKAMNLIPAVAAGAAVYKAAEAIKTFGYNSVMAAADVEKYEKTLKVMLGSQGAARDRMQEYIEIAKETPFELNEVVEAGNQLQAIGRYSEQNLKNLGDLAAASGKPIDQVMTAYAKLSTGQKGEAVNMFRDLLISTEDWAKATGKGVKKNGELVASTEEMIKALPGILKAKGYYGMMAEQVETTHGQVSNLKDSTEQLKVATGDRLKPSFDKLVGAGSRVVSTLQDWVEIPVAQKIAEEKNELNRLVGIITDANTGEEERRDMLIDLKREYPDLLRNVDLETVKNEELRAKLAQVNSEYDRKIRLASAKELLSDEKAKLQKLETKKMNLELELGAEDRAREIGDRLENEFGVKNNLVAIRKKNVMASGLWRKWVLDPAYKDALERQASGTMKSTDSELITLYSDYMAEIQMIKNADRKMQIRGDKGAYEKVSADLAAQRKLVNMYEQNLSKQEREGILAQARGIDVSNQSTFDQLFGHRKVAMDFKKLRAAAGANFEDMRGSDWSKLKAYIQGQMLFDPDNPDGDVPGDVPGDVTELDKAQSTITGGGRSVKHITINIESLIDQVDNNFMSSDDDPESAQSFIEKLEVALQSIVNDVNYSMN